MAVRPLRIAPKAVLVLFFPSLPRRLSGEETTHEDTDRDGRDDGAQLHDMEIEQG
jgi:hypothetical protein